MKTCIITGATGYIGSHVLKYLLQKGWNIHIITRSESSYANVTDVLSRIHVFEYDGNIHNLITYFQQANADVVFHLAAAVITNHRPEQVTTLVQSNIQFYTEVLEAMCHCTTRLFVGTGTYWQNYNSITYNPVDLYAATKEASEKILQYYVDARNFRAITLRLFDVYGEDDKRPKLWNLLRDIAGTDKSIDVSPGEQYLDLVHISDVCTAYEAAFNLLISDSSIKNEIYGVSTEELHTLKEIISLFQSVSGKNIHVNFGKRAYKEREVMKPMREYKILPNWKANKQIVDMLNKVIEGGKLGLIIPLTPSLDSERRVA